MNETAPVARAADLLCRGFNARRARKSQARPGDSSVRRLQVGDTADFKPALRALVVVGLLAATNLSRASETACVPSPPPGMVRVPAGVHRPLFRGENDLKEIPVKAFHLDALPVTNADFLEFVRANPRWRRSQIKRLFADENYLKLWMGDLEIGGDVASNAPATHVSWFAAKAYAAWKGKRLPTVAEWEYAAAASPSRADGENDPEFQAQLLAWFSSPAPPVLPPVGTRRANVYGVKDLHGLVWEWVADFNTAMVTGDARGDTGLERQLFCAAGSQDAGDRANYAAFMRYGFRSSLKAHYTVHNLGFRCAKDL